MVRLKQAANVNAIREWEYGWGPTVQFTGFSSCIGVLGKIKYQEGTHVIGVHLAIHDSNDNQVTVQDIRQIKWLLERYGYVRNSGIVIGQISVWANSHADGLNQLKKDLGIVGEGRLFQLAQGTYGGEIDDGDVNITY